MTTESCSPLLSASLDQIVQSVFRTMVGIEVRQFSLAWFLDADRVTASVHLTGEWNGALLIECDRLQACQIAGRFLSMDTPADLDDDVRDVMGEMANMVGGNLKCVLPPGIQLSVPDVVDGNNYSLHICGAAVSERLTFQGELGPFWVTILVTRK